MSPIPSQRGGRFALVWNPVSGSGKSRRRAAIARSVLEARNPDRLTLLETTAPGDARAFAREEAPRHDVLISIGGDGTANEIVGGLSELPAEIRHATTYLPLRGGTSSIISIELGIPRSPERALRLLDVGRPARIDRGMINGSRSFLLWTGIGFDGEIVRRVAAARSGTMSKFSYLGPIVSTLFCYRTRDVEVVVDGTRVEGTFSGVILANASTYGAYFKISRRAALTSGRLVVAALNAPTRFHWFAHGLWSLVRSLDSCPWARVLEANSVEVRSPSGGAPVQVDGDALEERAVVADIRARDVTVLVPRTIAEAVPRRGEP